jgi:hypothetical protein
LAQAVGERTALQLEYFASSRATAIPFSRLCMACRHLKSKESPSRESEGRRTGTTTVPPRRFERPGNVIHRLAVLFRRFYPCQPLLVRPHHDLATGVYPVLQLLQQTERSRVIDYLSFCGSASPAYLIHVSSLLSDVPLSLRRPEASGYTLNFTAISSPAATITVTTTLQRMR